MILFKDENKNLPSKNPKWKEISSKPLLEKIIKRCVKNNTVRNISKLKEIIFRQNNT